MPISIPLTLRLSKGSKLTFAELDQNFINLKNAINSVNNSDTYVTGGTYNPSTVTLDFSGNTGFNPFSVDVSALLDDTNTFTTGATLNGTVIEFNRNDLSNAYSVDLSSLKFTGNTSGDCISDIHVSNIHSCSPLNINPLDEGNVYFGSTSGITFDLINSRVGINTSTPGSTLDVNSVASIFGIGTVGRLIISDDYYGGELGIITDSDETIAIKYNDGTFRYGGGNPGSEPIVVSGTNVGIGTSNPLEKLEVIGKTKTTNLQITSGATNGYVLTSDSLGNATWQVPTGGGGVPEATTATTTTINFTGQTIYYNASSPGTGNISGNLTGAKLGLIQKIYHNSGTAPTYPAGWVLMGDAIYFTSTLNIIYAEWAGGTRVEYWYVQQQ